MDRTGSLVLALSLALLAAGSAHAQGTPYLVQDIDTTPNASSVAVRAMGAVGARVFFGGQDAAHGAELWTSDGTEEGTVLVKDIRPGPQGSAVQSLTAVGDALFFVVDDGVHGTELWTSDGTEDGTRMVRDVAPGRRSSAPSLLTGIDGLLYFVADDGQHGAELWISDGTEPGTVLVADVRPGATGAGIEHLVDAGGIVSFAADDGTHGREPWASDGTPDGTALVDDVNPGAAGSDPTGLVRLGDTVLFAADDGATGRELWRFDDPASGALRVADILDGTSGSSPESLVVAGELAYFTAVSTEFGTSRLWASDGTGPGTYQVSDVGGWFNRGIDLYLTAVLGDVLFFVTATEDGGGAALWRSDGTGEGTHLVKDLKTFPCSDEFSALVVLGDRLVMAARGPGDWDDELWISDGTEAGTEKLEDVHPGAPGSRPGSLTVADGALFFAAFDGLHGRELWRSDGTEAGTVLVRDILDGASAGGVSDSALAASLGKVLFSRPTGALWESDGTENGTAAVAAAQGLRAYGPLPAESGAFLFTSSPNQSFEPTVAHYDGTRLATLGTFPGTFISTQAVFGDQLYFGTDTVFGASGGELWRTTDDLTATTRLGTFSEESPRALLRASGAVFFVAGDREHGRELWKTDGTPQGTALVADVKPGPGDGVQSFALLGNLGRRVVFAADDGSTGAEPYITSGTGAGARRLRDIAPGAASSQPYTGVRAGGVVYFNATDHLGYELWRTDGSTDGTFRVLDIQPGPIGSDPHAFTRLGDVVLFAAFREAEGYELWRTDGSAAGTFLLADTAAGPADGRPYAFTIVGDVAYFIATAVDRTSQLWVTDGSVAGTRLAVDLSAGTPRAGVKALANRDGQLFLTANDGLRGNELWALSCGDGTLDPSEHCDDGASNGTPTSCCTGTCAIRDGAGEECDPIEGALELHRMRVQGDGPGPADSGRVVVDGVVEAGALLPLSVASGLVVVVRDGGSLDERLEWSSFECVTRPSGVLRCARASAVATFKPIAGAAAGVQRYRFALNAGKLAIPGTATAPISVRVRTSGSVDRAGAIEDCEERAGALACRR